MAKKIALEKVVMYRYAVMYTKNAPEAVKNAIDSKPNGTEFGLLPQWFIGKKPETGVINIPLKITIERIKSIPKGGKK